MSDLYDRDFYAWANEQAVLLRSGKLSDADILNIAEEIDSMGRGEKRELVSRLPEAIASAYRYARRDDSAETGMRASVFPATCPYSLAEIMDEAFWPGD